MQDKGLIRLEFYHFSFIGILSVRNYTARTNKLIRYPERNFLIGKTAYYQQFFFIQRPCINKQVLTVFQKQLILKLYHKLLRL